MCTGTALLYGIPRMVIGGNDTFSGGEALLASRGVKVVVVDDAACVEMMSELIAAEARAVERGHRNVSTAPPPATLPLPPVQGMTPISR